MHLFKRLLLWRGKKKANEREKATLSQENSGKLSFHVANIQMVGARENQEDSFATVNASDVTKISQNGLFAIVADGMGGMRDGKLVSEAAISEFIKLFHSLDYSESIPDQLSRGIYIANTHLYEKFDGDGGTTAVMVIVYADLLYWASVGDSTIFLLRDGGLTRLNKEHTYMNQLYLEGIRDGEVDKESVLNDPDKVRLSAFLGMDILEEIDYNRKPLRLRSGDVLLLCSDGISGVVQESEIMEALAFPPPEACARLNDAVIRHGNPKQDNYTGLIIACKQ